jgi:glycosyltransferase involved in cell wall biosynthesis
MKDITVFTPTYNRGYRLGQLYQSLLRQTNKNFIWLIIDDGSNDDTRELVEVWVGEGAITINYIYQENQGMLGAHNTAYNNIDTLLNVCVDSDDYLTDNCIERILILWAQFGSDQYAGLLGLDINTKGEVIGTKFPEGLKSGKFSELSWKHKVIGDKKFVYRTDVINEFPRFPMFPNEKFPAAGYLYRQIDKKYDLLFFNENFCVVEYLADGNSKNKLSQYRKSPNSFAYYRLERMRLATTFHDKFKNGIHYVSSCLIAGNYRGIVKNKYSYITILAFPFGVLLALYIMNTKRKNLMQQN